VAQLKRYGSLGPYERIDTTKFYIALLLGLLSIGSYIATLSNLAPLWSVIINASELAILEAADNVFPTKLLVIASARRLVLDPLMFYIGMSDWSKERAAAKSVLSMRNLLRLSRSKTFVWAEPAKATEPPSTKARLACIALAAYGNGIGLILAGSIYKRDTSSHKTSFLVCCCFLLIAVTPLWVWLLVRFGASWSIFDLPRFLFELVQRLG